MLLHEKLLDNKLRDKGASYFLEQNGYEERMDYLKRNSNLSKFHKVSDRDIVMLGQQFQMFENYVGFCESFGSTAELGAVPQLGLDILTGIYGNSIVPFVGGTQNLKEEEGLIYFKRVRAGMTRGNLTEGQVIRDPRQAAQAYQSGYATEKQGPLTVSTTSNGVTVYNISLPQTPVKPGTIELYIPGLNIEAMDNRKGALLGANVQGTVNYLNGTIALQLLVSPTTSYDIVASYDTDFESTGNVPIIQTDLDKINVKAEIVALRGQTSIYKNYAMQMRFGQQADTDMVNTLINEITAEINYKICDLAYKNAVGVTKYDPVPQGNVSEYEHKQEFMSRWNAADVLLKSNAGRGTIQTILAGEWVCERFASMPKFVPSNIVADGPHVYGTIDNKTIIRVPSYPKLEAIGLFRGMGMFDTGFMYAPYMPLYVNGSIPSPQNILVKEGLVTTWSAFKVVVPRYFTKFVLTQQPGANYV